MKPWGLLLINAMAFLPALVASAVLARRLAKPWRQAVDAHWNERARLAYAPGVALLWLAVFLPPLMALLGGVGLDMLVPPAGFWGIGFWTPWLAATAGILTVRYRWLRELWGKRVTLRSWLAGCLVLLMLFLPHLLIMLALVVLLPETFNARAAAVMGAGVAAVAFFAFGGGVLLLRVLGIVKPAAPEVDALVEELARQMNVPGRVKVFSIEWAQVNAVAWPRHRAIGFSRPLLELLSRDEVRAVAAHELAHLLEPRWMRTVRLLQMFAFLAAAPVLRYGGPAGILAGWLLVMGLMLGFRRLSRRMEVRADRLEHEAIADSGLYMRSLVKLYEANTMPAVMPGKQGHPHLYDRLLAAGVQPDFPRPAAPARTKPLLTVLLAGMAALLTMLFLVGVALAIHRSGTAPPVTPESGSRLP